MADQETPNAVQENQNDGKDDEGGIVAEWLAKCVHFSFPHMSEKFREEIKDTEAARPAAERLCNRDGALFTIRRFIKGHTGSILVIAESIPLAMTFQDASAAEAQSALSLPRPPFCYAIKTRKLGSHAPLISCFQWGTRNLKDTQHPTDKMACLESLLKQVFVPMIDVKSEEVISCSVSCRY